MNGKVLSLEDIVFEFRDELSEQTIRDLRHAAGALWAVEANQRIEKWPHLEDDVFWSMTKTKKDVSMFPNGTPRIVDIYKGASSPDKSRDGASWPRFIKRVFAETWTVWKQEAGPAPLSVPKIGQQENDFASDKDPLRRFSRPALLAYYICMDVDPRITTEDCWWVVVKLRKEAAK